MSIAKSIVLVHGGFVDGSGWEGVYQLLKKDGFDVIVAQNPTISLTDDVAVTKRAIAMAKGDVVLVGHSYGGAVVSEAGNDPKVTALVYITAFALDRGESVSSLIANPPQARLCLLSSRRLTDTCSSIGRNLQLHSPPMFVRTLLPSWQIRRFHGGWKPCRGPSVSPHGAQSRVGILSQPTTG
jgi:pimeloyl-ACP methyl ester carboxylesterase